MLFRSTLCVQGADRVLVKAERWVHPRMGFMLEGWRHPLIGVALVMQCIALALPIPIPGNNVPPAIGIVVLALGMLERDGLMIIIGYVYNLVLWAVLLFFGAVVFAAAEAAWLKYSARVLGFLGLN